MKICLINSEIKIIKKEILPKGNHSINFTHITNFEEALNFKTDEFPDIFILGQTIKAMNVLDEINNNFLVNPLIIRFSSYFGSNKFIYRSTPNDNGYHIDAPKDISSIKKIVNNKMFLDAVQAKDVVKIKEALPEGFNLFGCFDKWQNRKSIYPDSSIMHEGRIWFYHYFDKEGIESLFEQTGKKYMGEVIHKNLKTIKGKGVIKLTFGKLLELLGVGGSEVTGELEIDKSKEKEYVERLSPEEKMQITIETLKNNGEFAFLDLEKSKLNKIQVRQFIELIGWFNTKDFKRAYDEGDWVSGFSKFTHHSQEVEIGTSLKKYRIGLNHVHDFLGSNIDYPFPHQNSRKFEAAFRVFGQVIPKGRGIYIKPFALHILSGK